METRRGAQGTGQGGVVLSFELPSVHMSICCSVGTDAPGTVMLAFSVYGPNEVSRKMLGAETKTLPL
jgi:hypothetical protein